MVFLSDNFLQLENKAAKIHSLLIQKKQTLAIAESCTGGLLSYFLTTIPGSSDYFLGSLVSYSYLIKTQDLKIPSSLLNQKGAVNKSVAQLMAQGIKNKWKSDWALSITGVAGPGKNAVDPEVGTVFIGLLGPDYNVVEQFLLKYKNRKDIQYKSVTIALDFLHYSINKK